jgi:putative transposase
MTDAMTRLCQLAEKAPHTDLRREMIACASERLMRLEYGGLTGAGYGELECQAAGAAQRPPRR